MPRPQSAERVRTAPWLAVTIEELNKCFGLLIVMGIYPKAPYHVFGQEIWFVIVQFFEQLCRDRFMSILKFLHVVDNRTQNTQDTILDSLRKLRPFIDTILSKFKCLERLLSYV